MITVLTLAVLILIAALIFVCVVLILLMTGRAPILERPGARNSPSPADPTSSPQLAVVEAPSSATDNPAVAEQRFQPAVTFSGVGMVPAATPPVPSRMHAALQPSALRLPVR